MQQERKPMPMLKQGDEADLDSIPFHWTVEAECDADLKLTRLRAYPINSTLGAPGKES
jgi:hypothetical protein